MTFEEVEIQARKYFREVLPETERFTNSITVTFYDSSEIYIDNSFIQHVDKYTIVYGLYFITPFIFLTDMVEGFSVNKTSSRRDLSA
jgi:hypothetical protein